MVSISMVMTVTHMYCLSTEFIYFFLLNFELLVYLLRYCNIIYIMVKSIYNDMQGSEKDVNVSMLLLNSKYNIKTLLHVDATLIQLFIIFF